MRYRLGSCLAIWSGAQRRVLAGERNISKPYGSHASCSPTVPSSLSSGHTVGLNTRTWIYQSGDHHEQKPLSHFNTETLIQGIVYTDVEAAERPNRGWGTNEGESITSSEDKSQRGSRFTRPQKPLVGAEATLCLCSSS